MKKLMFASVLAAGFGLMAATPTVINSTDFEAAGILGKTNIASYDDNGTDSGSTYFCYEQISGSVDGSVVKAFGGDDNLPAFSYNKTCGVPDFYASALANGQYLELSTEGGILWRTFSGLGLTEPVTLGVGDSFDYSCVYFDSMVQFTPTEDGTAPAAAESDKLAIWLNVTPDTDPNAEQGATKTNLCVLAAQLDAVGALTTEGGTTFTITNATVEAGTWYRLTVKAVPNIGGSVAGFAIYLDGVQLVSDEATFTDEAIAIFEAAQTGSMADVSAKKVFANLMGYDFATASTIAGVGFKGSGAIDDLVITDELPEFLQSAAGTLDFTLTWDETVSAVSYSIGEGDVVMTSGTTYHVNEGSTVTITATPAAYYTIASGDGELTFTDNAYIGDITTAKAMRNLTVTLGTGVASATVQASDAESASPVTSGTPISVWQGATVAFTATAAAGDGWSTYAIDQASVADLAAGVEAAERTITATATDAESPISGKTTSAVKAWANAKSLTYEQVAGCSWAEKAYLLNTDLSAEPALNITAIEQTEDGWAITVEATQGATVLDLDNILGTLKVKTAATLAGLADATAAVYEFEVGEDGRAVIQVEGENTDFMKATIQ